MIPIGDDNRSRMRVPVVTWLLIAANAAVFVFLQKFGKNTDFLYSFAMVPAEILGGQDIVTETRRFIDASTRSAYFVPGLGVTPFPVYLTVFTSMFMHGGIGHIAGNMLFLAVFGDNVEDSLGHFRYMLFYFLAGIAAAFFHLIVTSLSGNGLLVPTIGASGAISGIMAAYLRLFPRNRVRVLIFNIIPTYVSAFFVIGMWFILQLINGMGILTQGSSGGVAYAAHIGGFIFGFLFIKTFLPKRKRKQKFKYRIIKD